MDTPEQRAIETVRHVKGGGDRSKRNGESLKRHWALVHRWHEWRRRHAINANQVFAWRKRYREGRLGKNSKLLPVTVSDIAESKCRRVGSTCAPSSVGTMEIKLSRGTVRIAGAVDVVALRAVVECLPG
jgi:hypothetical protein